MRRLTAIALLALSLSLTGCAALNPAPTEQCTLFGCKQTGNIVEEIGGMVLVMGIIGGAIAVVVRRLTK